MIEKLLHRVALFARRRYRVIFLVTLVLVIASIAAASQMKFDTEVLNLLPQDDPVVRSFRETLEEFGSLDFLLVVLRIPEGAVVDPYLQFADELEPALEGLEEVQYVDHRIGEVEELVESFFPQALLFLDEEERDGLASRLTRDGIATRVAELRRQLGLPQALAMRQLMTLDPLGVSEVFIDRLAGNRGALQVDWRTGYLLSGDRRLLLMVAKPVLPAQEVEFGRRLIAEVNRVTEETLAGWDEIAGGGMAPPEVALGGTYVIATEDAGYVARDIITNAVTSMLGVLILFFFAFRRLGLIVYAFVPLASGLVLAFGFAAISVGTLNAMTSSFAALLVGLGIDFVIVSYGRYVEEREKGVGLSVALQKMCGSSGRAVVTGGITTAATFYAFLFTKFSGLRQMGFLTGTGILFCMVCVLVLLPAMLAWREDRNRERGKTSRLVLHSFGSDRLVRWSVRNPLLVLSLGAVLTVVSLLMSLRLEFVDSIRNMRPAGNKGVLVQTEVMEAFGSGFDYMMLTLDGQTEDEVVQLTAQAMDEAEKLVDDGVLISVDSVLSVLPAPKEQDEALTWLAARREDVFSPGRVRSLFEEFALKEGINSVAFDGGISLFEQAAAATEPLTVSELQKNESMSDAATLLQRYILETPRGWKSVVYLYPPPLVAKRSAPPEVRAMADDLGEHAVLSGVNMVSERLRTQVKSDAIVAAVVGVVLVALLLWADYRRFGDALLSLAPLGVGLVWMLGGMTLFRLDMNFFNIFVTTMVIGIGVDYGVHMVHRFRETVDSAPSERLAGLEETAKAVVMAALSTSVGFGSMSMSSYPGLRSMGLVAIMGALATATVAVTLLPAFMTLKDRRVGRVAPTP